MEGITERGVRQVQSHECPHLFSQGQVLRGMRGQSSGKSWLSEETRVFPDVARTEANVA